MELQIIKKRERRPNAKDYTDGKWDRLYHRHLDEYIDWLENNNKETYEVVFEEKENLDIVGTG